MLSNGEIGEWAVGVIHSGFTIYFLVTCLSTISEHAQFSILKFQDSSYSLTDIACRPCQPQVSDIAAKY